MKKWLLVAFSSILVLSFLMVGCQSGKQPSDDASSSQTRTTPLLPAQLRHRQLKNGTLWANGRCGWL